MTRPPSLDVVIATFNSSREIVACLDAVRAASMNRQTAVIVVDNASTDGTPALVHQRFPDVDLIEAPRNLGFAAATNLGIRHGTSELLLLVNPDALVTSEAIDILADTLAGRLDVAACGPRLVDGEGRTELSFGRMMSPLNELRQKVLVAGHHNGWPVIAAHVERATRMTREVDWVSGACLCVRRAYAETAGLLDERYFLYAEDVDFCAALRGLDKKVLFVPQAEVVHLRGRSRVTVAGPSERAYRASQLAFYRKHHPRWAPVLSAYLRLKRRSVE